MDERQLRAFISIVDCGRMDLAASALGYSQPAISYQIKCLETSLRTRLFTRNSTGARLTPEGQKLLPAAKAMVSLFDSIEQTFKNRERTGDNSAQRGDVPGIRAVGGRRPAGVPQRRIPVES